MKRLPALLLTALTGAWLPYARPASQVVAYVGTGTESPSPGIFAFAFDESTGALKPLGLVATTPNPAFLAVSPNGRFLYAVNEANRDNKSNGHSVVAYAIDGAGPRLTLLDRQPCGGDRPAHVAVDPTGRFVFVANFGSGTMAMLPVNADGSLEPPSFVFQDPEPEPASGHPEGPHAHCVAVDPSDRFVYSCDLGADKVMIYRLDAARGVLTRNQPPFFAGAPRQGPRHIAIGRDGRMLYVVNETASTVAAYARNPDDGSLAPKGAPVSTLPAGWKGHSICAEIALHPSGRFLYVSNRGNDSIAGFAVGADGRLRFLGVTPCGKTPRHFAIDPTGRFLLAEAQDANSIRVFRVNEASGALADTGHRASVVMPTCLVFADR